jgi:predicted ATP-binding protein involved in virulence
MITPQDFPYITSIHVNDCYTYQDFTIDLLPNQPFSHLILTGKNGSGKSTVLKALNVNVENLIRVGKDYNVKENNLEFYGVGSVLKKITMSVKTRLELSSKVKIAFNTTENAIFPDAKQFVIYSYLLPNRSSKVDEVNNPTKDDEFEKQLKDFNSPDFFIQRFKQFLVNKKVNQAFAQLDNNEVEIAQTNAFFRKMEEIFGRIFEDNFLKLVFDKDAYEFFIKLGDGRELTFNVLPDGFSAFLSILMDLFVRLELIRKFVGNHSYDPCGIVLIDEPETHLHLSLQYQVLPILTSLFPNVQFIVATHSPAVISSIKQVTIFDLTTKETLSDAAVGKSFSELMVSHFGLDNEFSDFADTLFDKFNQILREYRKDIPTRNAAIKQLMLDNEPYISPTMRFELEAKLSE